MAIYNLDAILNRYGDEYLILEFNHLFVSSSIREEVWLLQRKNDLALIDRVIQDAAEFGLYEADADRNFETYSGGQKAILGCLLALALIRARETRGQQLLLNNILDSISKDNRVKLMQTFKKMHASHDVRVFTEKDGHLIDIMTDHDDR